MATARRLAPPVLVPQNAPAPAAAPPRGRRLWYFGFAGFVGLTMLGAATPVAPPAVLAAPVALAMPEPFEPPAAAPAAPPAATIDDALRLIAAAREAYRGVRDYSCVLAKRERLGAGPPAEAVLRMEVRSEPFSVHLSWLEPRSLAGQEACYVAGRNGGKMRCRSSGLLGAVGFVSVDPDDARARSTSRHRITEAGLGNLIERFARRWEGEHDPALTQVRLADYEVAGRPCTRVETVHPANPGGRFPYCRSVLYFDKDTRLPVRVECYDWPRSADDPGQLAECYTYLDLRLNVGLGDAVFDH
jgi:hypothetical protein